MANTASKVKGEGRGTWVLTFRHPVVKETDGKAGRRIRRSAGTPNDAEADRLVQQLNTLLADATLWSAASRETAAPRFDPIVVAAFYDVIELPLPDPWELRNQRLGLPDEDDGYSRVSLLGAIGSGKSTFLRQVIGTDPKRDRFPSTSTSRTTTSDLEVIAADEDLYRAVVAFMPEAEARILVEECVADAALVIAEGRTSAEAARHFLEHREQRFRLKYVVGPLPREEAPVDWPLDDADAIDVEEDEPSLIDALDPDEKQRSAQLVASWLRDIETLGRNSYAAFEELFGRLSDVESTERDDAVALILDEIERSESFRSLVDRVMDEISDRADDISAGEVERSGTGWPLIWTLTTADREAFIESVRRFSSNHAAEWGRSLAPLIKGIRLRGRFKPDWMTHVPRIVWLDGEGIGHRPSVETSLPLTVTSRFDDVQLILLVDSATAPMQAASLAAMRAILAQGHHRKLALTFTKMDLMGGVNFPDLESRREFVRYSIDNALNALGESVGGSVGRDFRKLLSDRTFYLSRIHKELPDGARATRGEVQRIIDMASTAIRPWVPKPAAPIYDDALLVLRIQKAMELFHGRWDALLGLRVEPNVDRQHWATIKALTRRLARGTATRYRDLDPAGDFVALMTDQIGRYLEGPVEWMPANATEEERNEAIGAMRRAVAVLMHEEGFRRLIRDRMMDWAKAFEVSGPGSTIPRARRIRDLYDSAAPIPNEAPTQAAHRFVTDLIDLVGTGIESAGGAVKSRTRATADIRGQ